VVIDYVSTERHPTVLVSNLPALIIGNHSTQNNKKNSKSSTLTKSATSMMPSSTGWVQSITNFSDNFFLPPVFPLAEPLDFF